MKTPLKIMLLAHLALPLLAFSSEQSMEKCLQKLPHEKCEQIFNPKKQTIELATLILAQDTLEASNSGKIGLIEEADKIKSGELRVEVKNLLSDFTKQSIQSQLETKVFITRKLINIFKSIGLQNHEYCLSLQENIRNPEVASAFQLISLELNGAYTDHRIIEKSINAIKYAEEADKKDLQRFQYEYETSGLCELTISQIRYIRGIKNNKVAPQRTSSDCKASAQTYQDRFRKSRNVNDLFCFRKAIEREYDQLSQDFPIQ